MVVEEVAGFAVAGVGASDDGDGAGAAAEVASLANSVAKVEHGRCV